MADPESPSVALFVTCLVDIVRPSVGFAAVRLLEAAGCRVSVPDSQTCCGQPAYNSGDRPNAAAVARQVIAACEGFDYVVVPSGSCAGMIVKHYPDLFAADPAWRVRAQSLSARTRELLSFLRDERGFEPVGVRMDAAITCHDSCAGLRELNIRQQPRDLLARVAGARLVEAGLAESCCGFGGLFCVKYPDISAAMADRKIDEIASMDADVVCGGDLGCLMNMAGRLSRRNVPCAVWHTAEILAGMTEGVAPVCGTVPDKRDGP